MTKLKDFSLALGVINNVLICDKDDNIIFIGDEIHKVLFQSKQSFKKKLLDNFSDPSAREGLKKTLREVRKNKNTRQFVFDKLGKTIFFFPANYNKSDNIILSLKGQILMANKIENELKERVKELECMFNISNELEINQDLPRALKKTLAHLIKGFQYPAFTIANFEVDGVSYSTGECNVCREPENVLTEEIVVNGETRGKIEICYHGNEEFWPEEVKLLKETTLMVSKFIEKKETRKDLEKQRKQLISQNEELTQLTDSLTTSNNNLKALFGAITNPIIVIDPNFNITMSNNNEIGNSGKCYKKLFNSQEICKDCPTKGVFKDAKFVSEEMKIGDQYYLIRSYPILDKRGNVDRVIEICRNITKEKQMEMQLIQSYKLVSLGKLTAGVAHEINNPNTFIRGNINIINEAFSDILPILDKAYEENPGLKISRLNYETFRENIPILLEDMVGGANRIKKIVDGLRNFARKDEGLLIDEIDINYLVDNNLRITQKEVRKHAKLKIVPGDGIPIFLGNIQKLEQVLMNLLINASQAIEHENGSIVLETAFYEPSNRVIVKISDNGKGIDDTTRRHIFDPFFTTKRDKGGTGLGLTISYGIIQDHNGRIDVESKVGEGTTFTISIPVVSPDKEQL